MTKITALRWVAKVRMQTPLVKTEMGCVVVEEAVSLLMIQAQVAGMKLMGRAMAAAEEDLMKLDMMA